MSRVNVGVWVKLSLCVGANVQMHWTVEVKHAILILIELRVSELGQATAELHPEKENPLPIGYWALWTPRPGTES